MTIERAKWFPVEGVFTFSELPEIDERPVYNLGMGSFDYHFKLRRGDFTVVAISILFYSPEIVYNTREGPQSDNRQSPPCERVENIKQVRRRREVRRRRS